jgi:hypothetical protein
MSDLNERVSKLELAVTSLAKLTFEEERDADGRWASGGGSSGTPRQQAAVATRSAMADVADKHGGTSSKTYDGATVKTPDGKESTIMHVGKDWAKAAGGAYSTTTIDRGKITDPGSQQQLRDNMSQTYHQTLGDAIDHVNRFHGS